MTGRRQTNAAPVIGRGKTNAAPKGRVWAGGAEIATPESDVVRKADFAKSARNDRRALPTRSGYFSNSILWTAVNAPAWIL